LISSNFGIVATKEKYQTYLLLSIETILVLIAMLTNLKDDSFPVHLNQ